MSNFYISRSGKQSGPFTGVQLKQMAESGLLDPHDQIAQEGGKQWSVAGTVKGLFPTPTPVATPITAAPIAPVAPEEDEMPWMAGDMEQPMHSSSPTSYKRKRP